MKSMYQHLRELWKNPKKSFGREGYRDYLVTLRAQPAVIRVERPTRLDRARSLGYKAKQGYFIVRSRVPKGSRKRPEIRGGRRPKTNIQVGIAPGKSKQRTAEERAARKYPNAEVLNSYWIGKDGKYIWYEVIFVDRAHPVIKADKKINWITKKSTKNRVYRGLTSAGKKGRGLVRGRRKNATKSRPSLRANKRRAK